MPLLLILVAVVSGALLPVQAGINSTLRNQLASPLYATLANFLVGAVGVTLVALLTRAPWPGAERAAAAPWWAWLGGLCGATLVCGAIVAVPVLGYTRLAAGIIAGQLVASLVMDHFGAFGKPVQPIDLPRIAGIACLGLGFWLIQFNRS